MKCPKCGTDLPDGARFCHYCGVIEVKKEEPIRAPTVPPEKKQSVPKDLPETIQNKIGMKLKLIPAGEYKRYEHKVTFTKPFYIGIYPVTQKEWKAVMGTEPSHFKGDSLPVECVSWHDCKEFIDKLNKKEGTNMYRLPTEAEWEYACRAGSTTEYYFGGEESSLGDYAWYCENSGMKSHPVGEKKPNAWGLYDMHGNVWEWCEDWKINYPEKDVTDPQPPAEMSEWKGHDQEHKIRRGGSWDRLAGSCTSGFRGSYHPDTRLSYVGVRMARTL